MYAAASGMAAQQTNLDIIADNLANADVAGFKSAAASFTDVNAGGTLGLRNGGCWAGTRYFEQGKLMKSGGPFDIGHRRQRFFLRRERWKSGLHASRRIYAQCADGKFAELRGLETLRERPAA